MSVIGPPSYVVAASDLHAKRPPNSMMKYADDSYLLVGSRQISNVNEEFSHIKALAASNNLQLNPLKTRELIVYRSGLGASVDPAPILQGAIRVTSKRVLGVTISSKLTMGCHLDEILSSSASSIHALRMLRSHGLGSPQLKKGGGYHPLGSPKVNRFMSVDASSPSINYGTGVRAEMRTLNKSHFRIYSNFKIFSDGTPKRARMLVARRP